MNKSNVNDGLAPSPEETLSPEDAAAMDAILNKAAGNGAAAERMDCAQAWLNVLGKSPMPEPRGDLAQRTLAAVEQDRVQQRMKIVPVAMDEEMHQKAIRRRWSRRMAEWGAMAVAAMLLIAVALMGMDQAKKSALRVACNTNLKNMGMAFGSYSVVSSGELPSLAMPSNRNWLHGDVATGARNNAANLLPLINEKYVSLSALFCAGAGGAGVPEGPLNVSKNELPEIGYSYRNLYGAARPEWDGRVGTMILADRNPLLSRPGASASVADRNSRNHDGRGQYVLRADASVTWETSPNVGPDKDNIWTMKSGTERVTSYMGTEAPSSTNDVFLCP